jgi:hypothetical protein
LLFGCHYGEHCADIDLLSLGHRHFGDDAVGRCADAVLHLHRFEPEDRVAGLDVVAGRHRDSHHRARHRRE